MASRLSSGEKSSDVITGAASYVGGCCMSITVRTDIGVSSRAPSAIHWRISLIWVSDSGSFSLGISALPSLGVIWASRLLASGLPGTTAGWPLSPPLSKPSKLVITSSPIGLAG